MTWFDSRTGRLKHVVSPMCAIQVYNCKYRCIWVNRAPDWIAMLQSRISLLHLCFSAFQVKHVHTYALLYKLSILNCRESPQRWSNNQNHAKYFLNCTAIAHALCGKTAANKQKRKYWNWFKQPSSSSVCISVIYIYFNWLHSINIGLFHFCCNIADFSLAQHQNQKKLKYFAQ